MRRLAYLRAEVAEVQGACDEAEIELARRVEERERAAREAAAAARAPREAPIEVQGIDPGVEVIVAGDVGESAEETHEEEDNQTEEEVVPEAPRMGDHYKKLWRVIAKETHPDVAGDDPELTSLYKTASKAYKEGDTTTLIDVAADLGVRLGDPEPELVVDAAGRCDFYVQKLESLKGSTVWLWGSSSPEAKEAALEILLKTREEREKKQTIDKKDC